MTQGDLYQADVLGWSEHQARLLRQVADGTPGIAPATRKRMIGGFNFGHRQRKEDWLGGTRC